MKNYTLTRLFLIPLSVLFLLLFSCKNHSSENIEVHIRLNQSGFFPGDIKVAVAFSNEKVKGIFVLTDIGQHKDVFKGRVEAVTRPDWGNFNYYYRLDFSDLREPGEYRIVLSMSGDSSAVFSVGDDRYRNYPDTMLIFMRQQRCGYNPFLDVMCHQKDGKTMYGPMPDSTFIDVSGGWHDAGDQLKYLITSSNATARMLMAWEAAPEIFADHVDALGKPVSNNIPDILDEAKWGLDWIHKMHPAPGQLFHQVADDRDHISWKWPDKDSSDYGWGRGSYRVVYGATGTPQGLRQYKSEATGIANLAGRCAAAMAIASRIWSEDLKDTLFAGKCLEASLDLYRMGKEKEGFQQGNSYGAPYRYMEDTWADDMEWGAVELYKATDDPAFLEDAKHYARMAGSTSWMNLDSAEHYRYYPFANIAHARLYNHSDENLKEQLSGYYRDNIQTIYERAETNPFYTGIPFIWCSNNLVAALVSQILLYEEMTGDMQYHDLMIAHRDWLFGKNPWGTSMFTGLPAGGEYPEDVHTSIWYLTHQIVPGGLVDGPVFASIYNSLIGLTLTAPDEFADFQNDFIVYHDDIGDYSTNEPTMDGTADAIYMMALLWWSSR